MDVSAVNFAPTLRLVALVLLLASLPLGWVLWRHRRAPHSSRLALLTGLSLFLTFDLIVFGAFTRLSDSGLGCPDWPGCYGHASPLGADAHIEAAQSAQPSGPVTFSKAWVEMIHRYLAMTVGLLTLVLAAASWRRRERLPHALAWPLFTVLWVLVQGLFGKFTVTWKLYPAIVTAHLLGGMVLLALLAWQNARLNAAPLPLPGRVRGWAAAAGVVLLVQMALGAWVSSNYAVLACSGFPQCNGQWWPAMDFAHGFTLKRELGRAGSGDFLPFDALVAIHMAHRLFAVVASAALLGLLGALWRCGEPLRAPARWVGALLLLQVGSGLSNVVLGWPLLAALLHTAGAAALVLLLCTLLARSAPQRQGRPAAQRLQTQPA